MKVKEAFAMRDASAKFLRSETHHIAKVTLTKWFKRLMAKYTKKYVTPDRYPDMKYVITLKINGTTISTGSTWLKGEMPSVSK